MTEPVFEVNGLEFAYGESPLFKDLSLAVTAGRFHGVVGPNGSGKTTLIDLLVGGRRPAGGEVRLRGRHITKYSRRALAREVAFVPQEFAVNFPFTVEQVVMMGRHPHLGRFGAPGEDDRRALDRAMDLMALDVFRHRTVTRLSGGEKQRVVLARALAQDAPVLLLDEPTSNLDVNHSLHVLAVVEDMVQREGRTAVAVMHDLNLAAAFCQELIFLKQGRVHAAGPAAEVLTAQNLRDVFEVEARVAEDEFAGGKVITFKKYGGLS
jgi:iron complex transport system ATP-binding protein